MKINSLLLFTMLFILFSCNNQKPDNTSGHFKNMLDEYYNQRMQMYPLEATTNGDNRYNNILPIDISESYRSKLKRFYSSWIDSLKTIDEKKLDENDATSFEILQWDLQTNLEGFNFPDHLMPINQFWSLPLTMGQLGSGSSNQPFKTVNDYKNFLQRIDSFYVWTDTAIANMKRGMTQHIVLPKILAERVVPQMQAMITTDAKTSVFYMPVTNMPADFSANDKTMITDLYTKAINEKVSVSYTKLYNFFKDEYLPACRNSSGISDVPGGNAYYDHLIKYWTTTTLSADSIFNLGMNEVNRIKSEMMKVKDEVGFKGDLKSFFKYINSDKQFFPFQTDSDVIQGYRAIFEKEKPEVQKLFTLQPKSSFQIRETEAFRAASASPEYQQGTPDGSRPGIFYIPILNAKEFNTVGMESLFLHEAIPGHHFQMSLQMENDSLPQFRKFIWYGAYGEGWALYCESLGKELGLYTDPYQYFGSLSEEMHRAIRLVVDVGMHTKGWTREQAIAFSLENEAESEQSITQEIERYMAIPGQALSYKIGQLTILALRQKSNQQLGDAFSIADFHQQVLQYGCLPLKVLEDKINNWIAQRKTKK